MKKLLQVFKVLFFFLLFWLLDQQFSLFFSYFGSNHWYPVLHLSLIYLLFSSVFYQRSILMGAGLLAGFLLDSYIFQSVGVFLVLLPICNLILSRFNHLFLRNSWTILLSMTVLFTVFEGILFFVAGLLGVAALSWVDFAVFSFAPSLVLNLVLTGLAIPLFRFFLARSNVA